MNYLKRCGAASPGDSRFRRTLKCLQELYKRYPNLITRIVLDPRRRYSACGTGILRSIGVQDETCLSSAFQCFHDKEGRETKNSGKCSNVLIIHQSPQQSASRGIFRLKSTLLNTRGDEVYGQCLMSNSSFRLLLSISPARQS